MSRLPEHTRPRAYAVHVHVDPKQDAYDGSVEIDLRAPTGARSLVLHAVDLDVSQARVEDAGGPVPVQRIRSDAKRETLSLSLGRGLRKGSVRLRLDFAGRLRLDLRGLYLARSGRRRYAATQLEAADARRFFPCFDEPVHKARFQISVTTPAANAVVSNSPVRRTERKGRLKTVHFRETPPLSTYLVALVVGELEASRTRRCGDTPIRVWSVPGRQALKGFALEAAVESLRRLEHYFGLPYPYEKLDLIAVPDFEFGAMENAGAVTFRESLLLVDPRTVTLAERKRVAEVMAHELAHMWFGDLVTMEWWDDLWLNEAFATWMAFTVVDDWKPDWKMWLDFEHGRSAAFELDALRNTHPIYAEVKTPEDATENFDLITYEKGAAVVRMIERWLGPAVFRRGVRRYIRRHREANARAADLWNALEEASGTRVAPVVRAWIERPGFPLVSVARSGPTRLALAQERYAERARSAPEKPWPIPAVIRVGGRRKLVRRLVTRASQRVDLGPGPVRWVYANADESGFFHPLHAPEELALLRENLGQLGAAERMGLVAHQWAGVRAGRAELEDLLDLCLALVDEPESDVLNTALLPLGWIDDQVLPQLDEASAFRARVGSAFLPGFEALGWKPRRGEDDRTRLRRASLLRVAGGIAEDAGLLGEVDARVRAYLRDRAALDPNLAGPVVELAARRGDKSLYEAYLRVMRKARTPQERVRFEMALGSFRDPALVARTLELSLGEDVPTQDVVPLLVRLLANPAGREATWQFVTTRWNALSPRVSSGLASRLVKALSALQTREYRKQVAAFFRSHPIPSARRTLRQTLEQFDLNAALRRRATPSVRNWLGGDR
jgi:puromycin-sensitive aminopeptidase